MDLECGDVRGGSCVAGAGAPIRRGHRRCGRSRCAEDGRRNRLGRPRQPGRLSSSRPPARPPHERTTSQRPSASDWRLTNNPFAYRWVRRLDFEPGKLNIVTGTSARGKSALLDIVEYCIARSRVTLPIGPISQTVAWYAVVLQLPSVQAFVARPAPRQGAASSSQAMFRLGKRVSIPSSSELAVDIDDDSVRLQLGSLIGIEEIVRHPPASTLLNPIPINIKHALLLCFQGQSEIGSRTFLFHRQGEQGIAPAIRSTLPYFLGATPADYALKHQQLTSLKRDLRRVEGELREANSINEEIDFDVRSLLTEAYARGLVDSTSQEGRDDAIAALRRALGGVV